MDFFEAVNYRRSCRRYTQEPVPETVIEKCLDAAVLAPNSSNMQMWEFYWVRTPDKKAKLVEACLSQPAASTAPELIVCVSRLDVRDRNRKLIIEELHKNPKMPKQAFDYYQKLMPLVYLRDFFGIAGSLKWLALNVIGLFRPVPRGPCFKSEQFEIISKSAALACENIMLAAAAQGYDSCPMEGFDEKRVKKLLGLNRHCHVVMVISIGKRREEGIWGTRFRVPKNLVIKRV